MTVFASFLRLWLWFRFLPVLAASLIEGADRAAQAVAYPFLFNGAFLVIAAYQLYRLDRQWLPLARLATFLAVAHFPFSVLGLNLLADAPNALRVLVVDLPALLLLLRLYRSARPRAPRR